MERKNKEVSDKIIEDLIIEVLVRFRSIRLNMQALIPRLETKTPIYDFDLIGKINSVIAQNLQKRKQSLERDLKNRKITLSQIQNSQKPGVIAEAKRKKYEDEIMDKVNAIEKKIGFN